MTVLEPARRPAASEPVKAVLNSKRARWCAGVAAGLGVGSAIVSLSWALGGTWLLDTVGGAIEAGGRAGSPLIIGALWAAILLKLVGAALPLLAVSPRMSSRLRGPVRLLCGVEAFVLLVYGVVLTVAGLLVQTGLIQASADADHRALAWHAFLWDPWFAVWGALVALVLVLTRPVRPARQRIRIYRG